MLKAKHLPGSGKLWLGQGGSGNTLNDNFHACPGKLRLSRGSLGSLLVINPSAWRQMEAALPLTHGFWSGLLVGFGFGFEFWNWSHAAAALAFAAAAVAVRAQIINLTNCLGDWQTPTTAACLASAAFTEHQQQIVICIQNLPHPFKWKLYPVLGQAFASASKS